MENITTLEGAIKSATKTIDQFFNSTVEHDKQIPIAFLQQAKGLAFLTVVKAGLIWTGKLGVGCVIAKLPDGRWSAPSAIGTAGVGFGAEFGGQVIDFMIILSSDSAVRSFMQKGQVSIGTNMELAAGPYGRAAGANANITTSGIAPNYTYSHSKGLFGGIGLQGSAIASRNDLNKKFYGFEVSPTEILSGGVDPPLAATSLYDAIARILASEAIASSGESTRRTVPAAKPVATSEALPPAAQGGEVGVVYNKVLSMVEIAVGAGSVPEFKNNCKSLGQDAMAIEAFIAYLRGNFTQPQLVQILPDLVKLLPEPRKRSAIWNLYLQMKSASTTSGSSSSNAPSLF